ncbi:MAG: hypothetical protein WDW38_003800 [Sanguina aurantia]
MEAFTDSSVYEVPRDDDDDDDEVKRWTPSTLHLVIVGAGPTGLLAAHYLAKRGYNVDVYDKAARPVAHGLQPQVLMLSSRAAIALGELGLDLKSAGPSAQPMNGVWDLGTGTCATQDTTTAAKKAFVVERDGFCAELISAGEKMYPGTLNFHFETELQGIDFKQRTAVFVDRNAEAAWVINNASPNGDGGSSSEPSSSSSGASSSSSRSREEASKAVAFDLVVGADGGSSKLRSLMEGKVKEFFVQSPFSEVSGTKLLHDLPQPAAGREPVAGFSSHAPQEYLYQYSLPNCPRITLMRDSCGSIHGSISGVASWGEEALEAELTTAYGDRLPAAWVTAIAFQAGGTHQPTCRPNQLVQCTQAHGPRAVLLGSAAHAVSNATQQGINAAVESVRTFHLVLRGSADDLERVPEVYSNVRQDAVQSMQFMDMIQMSGVKGAKLKYTHWIFHSAALLAQLYWASARAVAAMMHAILPSKFLSIAQLLESLRDRRTSYSDVSRMLQGYAAPPFMITLAAVVTYIVRGYMRTMAAIIMVTSQAAAGQPSAAEDHYPAPGTPRRAFLQPTPCEPSRGQDAPSAPYAVTSISSMPALSSTRPSRPADSFDHCSSFEELDTEEEDGSKDTPTGGKLPASHGGQQQKQLQHVPITSTGSMSATSRPHRPSSDAAAARNMSMLMGGAHGVVMQRTSTPVTHLGSRWVVGSGDAKAQAPRGEQRHDFSAWRSATEDGRAEGSEGSFVITPHASFTHPKPQNPVTTSAPATAAGGASTGSFSHHPAHHNGAAAAGMTRGSNAAASHTTQLAPARNPWHHTPVPPLLSPQQHQMPLPMQQQLLMLQQLQQQGQQGQQPQLSAISSVATKEDTWRRPLHEPPPLRSHAGRDPRVGARGGGEHFVECFARSSAGLLNSNPPPSNSQVHTSALSCSSGGSSSDGGDLATLPTHEVDEFCQPSHSPVHHAPPSLPTDNHTVRNADPAHYSSTHEHSSTNPNGSTHHLPLHGIVQHSSNSSSHVEDIQQSVLSYTSMKSRLGSVGPTTPRSETSPPGQGQFVRLASEIPPAASPFAPHFAATEPAQPAANTSPVLSAIPARLRLLQPPQSSWNASSHTASESPPPSEGRPPAKRRPSVVWAESPTSSLNGLVRSESLSVTSRYHSSLTARGRKGHSITFGTLGSMTGRVVVEEFQKLLMPPNFEESIAHLPMYSLVFIHKSNSFRRAALRVTLHPLFDWVMLAAIMGNCVTLAMWTNEPGFHESEMGAALHLIDIVWLGMFTLEFFAKVLALGFIRKPYSYCRRGWNILDLVVLATGWLELSSLGDVTAIRCLRVLRPLRSITRIPELQILVMGITSALPMLLDVLMLALFYYATFGVVTTNLFASELGFSWATCAGGFAFSPAARGQQSVTGASARDLRHRLPRDAVSVWTWLLFFVLIILGTHVLITLALGVLYMQGRPTLAYVSCSEPLNQGSVLRGAKRLTSSARSHLTMSGAAPRLRQRRCRGGFNRKEEMIHESRARAKAAAEGQDPDHAAAGAKVNMDLDLDTSEAATTQAAAVDLKRQLLRAASYDDMLLVGVADVAAGAGAPSVPGSGRAVGGAGVRGDGLDPSPPRVPPPSEQPGHSPIGSLHSRRAAGTPQGRAGNAAAAVAAGPRPVGEGTTQRDLHPSRDLLLADVQHSAASVPAAARPDSMQQLHRRVLLGEHLKGDPASQHRRSTGGVPEAAVLVPHRGVASRGSLDGGGSSSGADEDGRAVGYAHITSAPVPVTVTVGSMLHLDPRCSSHDGKDDFGGDLDLSDIHMRGMGLPTSRWESVCDATVEWCNMMANNKNAELVCNTAIVINAVLMGIQWFGMSPEYDYANTVMSYAFALFFGLEMLWKVTGLGADYFQNSGHCVDGVVTVGALAEFCISLSPVSATAGNALSALRSVRLLRLLRLARTMVGLNRVITTLLHAISSVAYLTLLLLLFAFIMALLGVQLFSYKVAFCDAVEGSYSVCPPGVQDCPLHRFCYLACEEAQVGTWFDADGSPYNGRAYCERFPRQLDGNSSETLTYLAQVGKPDVPRSNFDDIFNGLISTFTVLTVDTWGDVMHDTMKAVGNPYVSLYFVAIIVIGNFMLLQLFLAILLDSFNIQAEQEGESGTGEGTSASESRLSVTTPPPKAGRPDAEVKRPEAPAGETAPPQAGEGMPRSGHSVVPFVNRSAGSCVEQRPHSFVNRSAGSIVEQRLHSKSQFCKDASPYRYGGHRVSGLGAGKAGGVEKERSDPRYIRDSSEQMLVEVLTGRAGTGQDAFAVDADGKERLGNMGRAATMTNDAVLSINVNRRSQSDTAVEADKGLFTPSASLQRVPNLSASPAPALREARTQADAAGPGVQDDGDFGSGSRDGGRVSETGAGVAVAGMRSPTTVRSSSSSSRAILMRRASSRQRVHPANPSAMGTAGLEGGDSLVQHRVGDSAESIHRQRSSRAANPSSLDSLFDPLFPGRDPRPSSPNEAGRESTLFDNGQYDRMTESGFGEPEEDGKHNPDDNVMVGRALFLFGPSNFLRRMCAKAMLNTAFEGMMLLFIVLSSVTVALAPLDLPDGELKDVLHIFDLVFTVVFGVEALMRVTVLGLAFNGRHSYLRSAWNVADFVLVLIQISVIVAEHMGVGPKILWLRAFRTLRVLRPLKFIRRFEGVRVVVAALFTSIPALGNVLVVATLFYYIAGVLFMSLLLGTMYNCSTSDTDVLLDPSYILPAGGSINRSWCEASSFNVTSSYYHSAIGVPL